MATTEAGDRTDGRPGGGQTPESALAFARRVHLGQHRKQDNAQYVDHPIAVAEIVARESGGDPRIIMAAYLHDVAEKTHVSLVEISERFGPEVGAMVSALTEDPTIEGYAERKRELRARSLGSGDGAALIYAADRIANVRDWLGVPADRRGAVADRLGTSLDERVALWTEDLDEINSIRSDITFLGELELGLRELRPGS